MTVDLDDEPDDDIVTSLSSLRHCDVSHARARRLRRRCHALLQAEPPAMRSPARDWASFRRVAVPMLAGAWCLAYLVAMIRCTAAAFGMR